MSRKKLKRLHSHKPRRSRHRLHKTVIEHFKLATDVRSQFSELVFDAGPGSHRSYYVRLAIEHQLPGPPPHDGSIKMKAYGVAAPQAMKGLLVAVSGELADNGYTLVVTPPLISAGPGMTLDDFSGAVTGATTP